MFPTSIYANIIRTRDIPGAGTRVGPATSATPQPNGGKKVLTAPAAALAAQAGLPADVYTLARLFASEGVGGGQNEALVHTLQGLAVLNEARRRKVSITQLLAPDGYYATQTGRYAATNFDPKAWQVELARLLLTGAVPDITDGAIHFFSPRAQVALNARNPAQNKPPETIVQNWGNDGEVWIGNVAGVNPWYYFAFRKATSAQDKAAGIQAGLQQVAYGRAGQSKVYTSPETSMVKGDGSSVASLVAIGTMAGAAGLVGLYLAKR